MGSFAARWPNMKHDSVFYGIFLSPELFIVESRAIAPLVGFWVYNTIKQKKFKSKKLGQLKKTQILEHFYIQTPISLYPMNENVSNLAGRPILRSYMISVKNILSGNSTSGFIDNSTLNTICDVTATFINSNS